MRESETGQARPTKMADSLGAESARALANLEGATLRWRGWPAAPAGLAGPIHPGVFAPDKLEALAYFWALELDAQERSLMARMSPWAAASAIFRYPIATLSGRFGADDPAHAKVRRLGRAALCARWAVDGEDFQREPWVEEPRPQARIDAPISAGPEGDAKAGAFQASWKGAARQWLKSLGGKTGRREAGAARMREGLAALRGGYPDLGARGFFDGVRDAADAMAESRAWSAGLVLPSCARVIVASLGGRDGPSGGEALEHLLSERPAAREAWPLAKLRRFKERQEIEEGCGPAPTAGRPARI